MITRNEILGLRDTVGIGYANELLGIFDHLKAARKTLEESERGRKANEHSMFSYMHQRDYLEKQRDELVVKLHASNTVIAALNIRVEDLSKGLAALRPPEPKFKVGQILVRLDRGAEGHAFSVRHVSQAYGGNWMYTNCKDRAVNGWINEYDLRAQTAQEKGE